ncbi:MAG: hypothetical protein ACKVP5_20905 [Aestuariivirga sp.]
MQFLTVILVAITLIAGWTADLRAEFGSGRSSGLHNGICAPLDCSSETDAIPGSAHHHCAQMMAGQPCDAVVAITHRSISWSERVFDLRATALAPDTPPPRA